MTEKETLRIVLTEEQELEVVYDCTIGTFMTAIVAAIQELELPDDKAARLFVEITQQYFRLNKGESK